MLSPRTDPAKGNGPQEEHNVFGDSSRVSLREVRVRETDLSTASGSRVFSPQILGTTLWITLWIACGELFRPKFSTNPPHVIPALSTLCPQAQIELTRGEGGFPQNPQNLLLLLL